MLISGLFIVLLLAGCSAEVTRESVVAGTSTTAGPTITGPPDTGATASPPSIESTATLVLDQPTYTVKDGVVTTIFIVNGSPPKAMFMTTWTR